MSVVEEIILSQKEKITDENRKSGRYGFEFGFGEGMDLIWNGYLSFGQYQIQQRHIPSLEDGLKPVQRRIVKSLHDYDKGKTGSNYVKSAKITADTMNKYHPHGDGSIYGAMVRQVKLTWLTVTVGMVICLVRLNHLVNVILWFVQVRT